MNNQVLNTYFKESNLSLAMMQEKAHKNFDKFLTGEKVPTFNQLVRIAKILNIPVGLLLINSPIKKSTDFLKFRTINSDSIVEQSMELQDSIAEMREKQDFLRGEIEYELDFIGAHTISDDFLQVAVEIRQTLEIDVDYYRSVTRANILSFLRDKMNQIGIFVFFNGKYKDNTHRPLNVSEFRGFVLTDKKAPIIFINQKDTKNGQLFTLVHELVHLFIGDEEILGTQNTIGEYDKTEAFVNKVTAEILVPSEQFQLEYLENPDIEQLSNVFKVSEFVIVRKLLDSGKIGNKEYHQLISQLEKKYQVNKKRSDSQKSTGGDYKNNIRYRIDGAFFNYVENALNNQKISYTDAFDIVGVGYKGYQILRESR